MEESTKKFLDAAVEKGWVTREQVEEVLRIQTTMLEVGVDQKIEDLLVKKGYLDEERADRLRRDVAGLKVGKYQILERLGEGGAGVVYKAVQLPLERTVAIKLLSRARVSAPEYLERFRREARIAVTLNHQHIVRGLDYGEADGYHYFVMEYVEGEPLQKIINREGMLDEKRAFSIALQVTEALMHAAEFALVHRDIKPENILMNKDGAAKLCDMGLAKPSMLETAEAVKSGATIGTPLYMSPEQILGKEESDSRSDIYSLGVALYETVTGQRPFSGATVDEIVRKHLREPPKDPRELNIKLTASAAGVILKMLAKKRDDRYGKLQDLHEDLRAVIDGRPPRHAIQIGRKRTAVAARLDLEDGTGYRARRGSKRSPLIVAAIAVVVLGAAAAAFFVLKPFEKQPSGKPSDVSTGEKAPPVTPSAELKASELLTAARQYEEENPDAPFEAVRDRYQIVVDQAPSSKYALDAKDRIRTLATARDAARQKLAEDAKRAFDERAGKAAALVQEKKYGAAAALFAPFPEEFADTEWPDRAAKEAARIRKEGEDAAKVVLDDAAAKLSRGDFAGAEAALDGLASFGLVAVENRVKVKRSEIADARAEEEKARAIGEAQFRAVVGSAFVRAARGEWDGAEEEVVKAGEEETLAAFRKDLDLVFRELRDAQRFESALVSGVRKLDGKAEKFGLLYPSGTEISGRVAGTAERGLRFVRGAKEEVVEFANLAPRDRLRIAFLALDLSLGEDHRAAALYFMVHGLFPDAEAEIEAARIAGLDPAALLGRKTLLEAYAVERADAEIRKAEILLTQKRPQEARNLLVAAATAAPAYAKLRFVLASVLLEMGVAGEAVAEFRRAAALGFGDAILHFRFGKALADAGQPEEAVQELEKYRAMAQKSDPDYVASEKLLGSLRESALAGRMKDLEEQMKGAFRKKDYEKTIKLADDLLKLNPGSEEGLYHAARARLDSGQVLSGYLGLLDYLERAPSGKRASDVKRLTKTIERDGGPNNRSIELNQKGQMEFEGSAVPASVQSFTDSIAAAPLNAVPYYNRGRAHLLLGELSRDPKEFTAARDDFAVAARLLPEKGPAWEGLALSCYYLEEYDPAMENARRAISAMPDRWQSFNVAGLVCLMRSAYEEAIAYFDKGTAVAPQEPQLDINKALVLERQERKADAAALLRTTLKKKVTEAQINQINEMLRRLGG